MAQKYTLEVEAINELLAEAKEKKISIQLRNEKIFTAKKIEHVSPEFLLITTSRDAKRLLAIKEIVSVAPVDF